MTATQRLRGIEQRAKALGWKFSACYTHEREEGGSELWPMDIANRLDAAEEVDTLVLETSHGNITIRPRSNINGLVLEDAIQVAERLLSCYEPGPVVKVKWEIYERQKKTTESGVVYHEDVPTCDDDCDFCYSDGDWGNTYEGCTLGLDDAHHPGPSCPGEGTYKLVKVEDGDG